MITDHAQGIDIHIRWMARFDIPKVLAIESASFSFPWLEEDFIRYLKRKNRIGMVAEHDDRIVGYMLYGLRKSRIHLPKLAVAQDFRLQGVGRQMMAKMIAKLSPKRRRLLLLEVEETNLPAQLFLRRLGFRAVSVLRDFYQDSVEDAYSFEFHILRETFYPE